MSIKEPRQRVGKHASTLMVTLEICHHATISRHQGWLCLRGPSHGLKPLCPWGLLMVMGRDKISEAVVRKTLEDPFRKQGTSTTVITQGREKRALFPNLYLTHPIALRNLNIIIPILQMRKLSPRQEYKDPLDTKLASKCRSGLLMHFRLFGITAEECNHGNILNVCHFIWRLNCINQKLLSIIQRTREK